MTLNSALVHPEGGIDELAWLHAFETKAIIGLCACGGPLQIGAAADGQPWEDHQGIRWLTTRCTHCDREASAPEGKLASGLFARKARKRVRGGRRPTTSRHAMLVTAAAERDARITGDR